jgi:hypothetical protein
MTGCHANQSTRFVTDPVSGPARPTENAHFYRGVAHPLLLLVVHQLAGVGVEL